jgi:sensor c-di-GMP phosphodiesterase-like protein
MDSYSYEDIYELLRNEKFSSDLQEFSSNNLKKIQKYFEERIEKLNETNSSNMFTSHNKLKIQSEVDNATRMVNDLIYHREKKIITRARFTSRSDENIEDTSNMTDLEKSLYNFLNAELKKFRTNYLNQIEDTSKSNSNIEKYRVLSDIPKLSDGNKSYGPYKSDDEIIIPENIAKILLSENKITNESEEFKNKVITENIRENEISKTSENVLSGKELQKTHSSESKTIEE